MSDSILPCNLPCPRCGTTAVTRQFDPQGAIKQKLMQQWGDLLDDRNNLLVSNNSDLRSKAVNAEISSCELAYTNAPDRPRIQNSCMICKYTWDSEPLSKGAA